MTEPHPDRMTDAQFESGYRSLHKATEFWIVVGWQPIAFRYGPFTPIEAGAIIVEAVKRKIAITVIGQCGREVDWQLADDLGCWLEGHPPRPEEPATPQGESQP